MKQVKGALVWIIIASLGVSGCVTTQPGGGAKYSSPQACIAGHMVMGAVAGAGAGFLLGAIQKDKNVGKKVVAGAVSGAVMGYVVAWGKCFSEYSYVKSEPVRSYQETAKVVNYTPEKGTMIKINSYTANPSAVSPNGKVTFKAEYYVMAPAEKEVCLVETRVLKVFDAETGGFKEVGRVPETVTVAPGTRNADGNITIPSQVTEGQFMVDFIVSAEGKTDTASIPLTVTTDPVLLARAETVSSGSEGAKNVGGSSEKSLTISTSAATVRQMPDLSSKVVATVKKGETYPVVKKGKMKGKTWFEIMLDDGRTGWLSGAAGKVTED